MKTKPSRRAFTRLLAIFILTVLTVVAYLVLKSTGVFGSNDRVLHQVGELRFFV